MNVSKECLNSLFLKYENLFFMSKILHSNRQIPINDVILITTRSHFTTEEDLKIQLKHKELALSTTRIQFYLSEIRKIVG